VAYRMLGSASEADDAVQEACDLPRAACQIVLLLAGLSSRLTPHLIHPARRLCEWSRTHA